MLWNDRFSKCYITLVIIFALVQIVNKDILYFSVVLSPLARLKMYIVTLL